LIEMKRVYDPLDANIREAATAILVAKKEDISDARAALVKSIRELEGAFREKNRDLIRNLVVYLAAADKYRGLTRRPSQEQKGLDERTLMASQRPFHPW